MLVVVCLCGGMSDDDDFFFFLHLGTDRKDAHDLLHTRPKPLGGGASIELGTLKVVSVGLQWATHFTIVNVGSCVRQAFFAGVTIASRYLGDNREVPKNNHNAAVAVVAWIAPLPPHSPPFGPRVFFGPPAHTRTHATRRAHEQLIPRIGPSVRTDDHASRTRGKSNQLSGTHHKHKARAADDWGHLSATT
jgi:hypothetical protein